MAIKRKPKRNSKKKQIKFNFKQNISNVIIGLFMVLILGFLVSTVSRFTSNSNSIQRETPDLSKLIKSTPYEKETGHKIKVEIQNGCGIAGVASLFEDYLRQSGFDVVNSTNATHFSHGESKILHHKGENARALELAKTMGIPEQLIEENKDNNLFQDLTLIIGNNHSQLTSFDKANSQHNPF